MISAGTLQIGNGGATGTFGGDVLDNGTLRFERSDVLAFGGRITGTGARVQAGNGSIILTDNASHTGGTMIAAGRLQVGNGGSAGAISGNIINNATLAFNRQDHLVFEGDVSGSGLLLQAGIGTTVLTGNHVNTGDTVIAAGTLQIGNGGTTGALRGNVLDNGVLAFHRSDNITFDGDISGSGAVLQAGDGTTMLTGKISYTGGTTVSAGVLQIGDGGTSGALTGDVLNNSVLAFNRIDHQHYAGNVGGNGVLVQGGSGTTVLTGTNSYTGGTAILSGTLQIGDGGSAGSITGQVHDDGTLAFNRSDSVIFSGDISGSGALVQNGAGRTTLLGEARHAGGTTVAAGTLQIGNGGTTGTLTGNLVNNAQLAFNRSDDRTFAGIISGTGAIIQAGTNTLTLGASNGYAGGTVIAAGTLLGQADSFGSGAIDNRSALVLQQDSSAILGNLLQGDGSLSKRGNGRLVITGINTLSGATASPPASCRLMARWHARPLACNRLAACPGSAPWAR